jgi:hypothetical protein
VTARHDAAAPAVVAIGMTWQDEVSGGLNRYLSDLHQALRAGGMSSRVAVAGRAPDDQVSHFALHAGVARARRGGRACCPRDQVSRAHGPTSA